MKIAKIPSQKLTKSILITLQKTFWNIRQALFKVWLNFKYYYSFHCPKANFVDSVLPYLVIIYVTLWLPENGISVKTYVTVSTSWLVTCWYNHSSRQFTLSFVHIIFWILRKTIRPNWNNCYNITKAPTKYTWV